MSRRPTDPETESAAVIRLKKETFVHVRVAMVMRGIHWDQAAEEAFTAWLVARAPRPASAVQAIGRIALVRKAVTK